MFKRYSLIKPLTKNFNILSNADADTNADANADAGVTAIALPVLSYRRAKNHLTHPQAELGLYHMWPVQGYNPHRTQR